MPVIQLPWPAARHPRARRRNRGHARQVRPRLTQLTSPFMIRCDITLAKSSWSDSGLCFSCGKASTLYCFLSWMSRGMSYVSEICSCGTALNPLAHRPNWSGNTMCVRWLALSVFFPSQQLGNVWMRLTLLFCGQIGYLSVTRFSNPVHVQLARSLAGPLVETFASP